MVDGATRARLFNIFVGILIAVMLSALAFTAILIVYSQIKDYLDIVTTAAYFLLLMIGMPLSILLYYSRQDRIMKKIMLGLTLTFSIFTLACLLSLISMLDPALSWFYAISQPALILAYLPIAYVLYSLLNLPETKTPDKVISRYVVFISLVAVLAISFFYLQSFQGFAGSPDIILNAGFAIMDVILMVITALLVLAYMPTQYRYAFSYIFFCVLLSFLGDSLAIISRLGLDYLKGYSDLLYLAMLIFCAFGLIRLSLMGIKATTVEEVDKKLSDSRLQMEDIIMQSPDGMAVFDPSGKLLRSNDVFPTLFGSPEGTGNGQSQFNIFERMSSLRCGIEDQITGIMTGKTAYLEDLEIPLTTLSDSTRYLSFKIFPTFSSDKTITGYVVVVQDTTARKVAELSLKSSNEELERRVQERTAQFEIANEALQQEVEARKAGEAHITASLHEKEVLLKEIHHRVKNNLQIVSSMLSLQSSTVKDPVIVAMNNDSQNRIRSMALIHEKLYRSNSLSQIDFGEYVKSLTSFILSTYNTRSNITVTVNILDVWLDVDTTIPCGLIVNELFSNCLKHAFLDEARGEVVIKMTFEGDQYLLCVRDNGTGMKADFNPETATTLGLSLVSALASQLEGSVEIRSQQGTEFIVSIPLQKK